MQEEQELRTAFMDIRWFVVRRPFESSLSVCCTVPLGSLATPFYETVSRQLDPLDGSPLVHFLLRAKIKKARHCPATNVSLSLRFVIAFSV